MIEFLKSKFKTKDNIFEMLKSEPADVSIIKERFPVEFYKHLDKIRISNLGNNTVGQYLSEELYLSQYNYHYWLYVIPKDHVRMENESANIIIRKFAKVMGIDTNVNRCEILHDGDFIDVFINIVENMVLRLYDKEIEEQNIEKERIESILSNYKRT
jgi:hypothetical protein